MNDWKRMLLGNQAWVRSRTEAYEDYFIRAEQRRGVPQKLWISGLEGHVGFADVTGTPLDELLVHRNHGNQVLPLDVGLLATLAYAVDQLEVRHVIVCGHYRCSAVQAALALDTPPGLAPWLQAIRDTYAQHRDELELHAPEARLRRFVELHTLQQVHNLARTATVAAAWRRGERPMLHGWVYDPDTGLLNALARVEAGASLA